MRWTMTAMVVGLSLAVAQAAPMPFPGPGPGWVFSYSENFDGGVGTEWTLDGWQVLAVPPSGYATVIGNGWGAQRVWPAQPSGLVFPGATFPLPAVSVDSYSNYGFANDWLTNTAQGATTATARVDFTNLLLHKSIDLSFLFAAGDTIDPGEGLLTIKVDGVIVFSRDFGPGGITGSLAGTGIVRLVDCENIDLGWYQEQWNDNGGAGPANDADRFALDRMQASVYDMTSVLALINIAHTGSTLSIEFIHDLDQTSTDEYFGIEGFVITLNDVIPEPTTILLFGLGGLGLCRRRRRC